MCIKSRLGPPVLALAAIALLTSCATRRGAEPILDQEDTGRILGGVAGAALGSQIGDGSGQTIATVAGALIGSVVGERIGARAERRDLERTAWALDNNRVDETTAWENPDTGHDFAVTPTDTYYRDERVCRDFRFRVETEYGEDTRLRTACEQPDGTWQIVD